MRPDSLHGPPRRPDDYQSHQARPTFQIFGSSPAATPARAQASPSSPKTARCKHPSEVEYGDGLITCAVTSGTRWAAVSGIPDVQILMRGQRLQQCRRCRGSAPPTASSCRSSLGRFERSRELIDARVDVAAGMQTFWLSFLHNHGSKFMGMDRPSWILSIRTWYWDSAGGGVVRSLCLGSLMLRPTFSA